MLTIKLLLVPSLIAAITLIGRRWGPGIAGLLSGFPIVAGPILLLIAIEQGPHFAALAANGSLITVPSNIAFALGYSWLALRWPWWVCLPGGLVCFALTAALFNWLALPLTILMAVSLAGIFLAARAFPRNIDARPLAQPSRMELPVRMLAAALLVLAVTRFADQLGPHFSGILSAPPILASVLAGFSHPVAGAGFAIRLLQGMQTGFFSLAAFCFGLALALPALGTLWGFLLALAAALLVQTAVWWRNSAGLAQPRPKHPDPIP